MATEFNQRAVAAHDAFEKRSCFRPLWRLVAIIFPVVIVRTNPLQRMPQPCEELTLFRQKFQILPRGDVTMHEARPSRSLQQWATNFLQRITIGLYWFSRAIVPQAGCGMSPAVKKQHRHLRAYFPDDEVRERGAGTFAKMDGGEHWHFNKLPVA